MFAEAQTDGSTAIVKKWSGICAETPPKELQQRPLCVGKNRHSHNRDGLSSIPHSNLNIYCLYI